MFKKIFVTRQMPQKICCWHSIKLQCSLFHNFLPFSSNCDNIKISKHGGEVNWTLFGIDGKGYVEQSKSTFLLHFYRAPNISYVNLDRQPPHWNIILLSEEIFFVIKLYSESNPPCNVTEIKTHFQSLIESEHFSSIKVHNLLLLE
jgi:hypothetical protein